MPNGHSYISQIRNIGIVLFLQESQVLIESEKIMVLTFTDAVFFVLFYVLLATCKGLKF